MEHIDSAGVSTASRNAPRDWVAQWAHTRPSQSGSTPDLPSRQTTGRVRIRNSPAINFLT